MKVLVLAENFMNSGQNLAKSIESLGYDAEVLSRTKIKHKWHLRIKYFLYVLVHPEYKNYHFGSVEEFSNEVIDKVGKDTSVVILDTLGINLTEEAVIRLSKTNLLIKRMGDSIESYPYLKKTLKYYDYVTTYESADIDNINEAGAKKVGIVNASYFDNAFYPLSAEKEFDICFVGKMFTADHKHRREIMEHLVREFPTLNFAIYGIYAKKRNIVRYVRWRMQDNGRYFKNTNIPPSETNELYNKSKICININSFQTINSWSARLPEMLGSGSFVVSEYTKESYDAFSNGCAWYKDTEELIQLIKHYINKDNDREFIANKGHGIAKDNYTKSKVMDKFMHDVEMLYESKVNGNNSI